MKMEWLYGDAWERFPIRMGELWHVGEHHLLCADLERHVIEIDSYLSGAPISLTMAYCDPPWNPGNANAFRTKAGSSLRADFPQLIRNIMGLFSHVIGDVYVEAGRQYVDFVSGILCRRFLRTFEITYYHRRPCMLIQASNKPLLDIDFAGMDDDDTPHKAILVSSQEGDFVFDPCVGRGLTAISATMVGRRCFGVELHPRRLAVTISKLVQMGHSIGGIEHVFEDNSR